MQPAKVAAVQVASDTSERAVTDEMSKFKGISAGILAEGAGSRYYEKGIFNHKSFWFEHRGDLPIHYKTFVAEVGSQKAAAANVETVFSGAGGMVAKAASLGADLLADYTICHYNWQYDFLLPSDEEIVSAYQLLYGVDARASDAEQSSSDEDDADDAGDEDAVPDLEDA